MFENGRISKRSRNAIILAIVVVICLLLSDCAHSLRSAFFNDVSTLPPVTRESPETALPGKPDAPLLAAQAETVLAADRGHDRSAALPKSGQRQEAPAPGKEPTEKIKAVSKDEPPASAQRKTQVPAAGAITQSLNSPPGDSVPNIKGAFGATFTEPISGMEFILVKGGCYQMGSNLTAFEGPVHEVCVDDFYLSKHEVTQRQWKIMMGRNFSYFQGNEHPVERVTWDDTQRFIRQLNSRRSTAYRLPTEAEWEYAARGGGKDGLYAGTSDEASLPHFAWHQVNSNRQTHMVGVKKPNGLGLHDMSGNVWEWCSDWYDGSYYAKSSRDNPQGPDNGLYRVIRGGEWELPAALSRTTYREAAKPNARRSDIGFRLALTSPK